MLTLFTPTYNRARTLPNLYRSILRQAYYDFEWIIVDDGSTDDTETLVKQWRKETHAFSIVYIRVPNGGKQRAINRAVQMAKGEYLCIVDSDDVLSDDAIGFIVSKLQYLPCEYPYVGMAGLRALFTGQLLNPDFGIPKDSYVEATNLERGKHHLQGDMLEVFRTDVLKRYPFRVWEGETFVPEATVWNQMAEDGWKIRWYNHVLCKTEYREDGLTKSGWKLLEKNPMGYAMLFNQELKHISLKWRLEKIIQFDSCCFLGREYQYIRQCAYPMLACMLSPLGYLLSLRRHHQFRQQSSQKKKVMFMIESMVLGGAERTLCDLTHLLDPSKYQVTILSIFKNSVYTSYNYLCNNFNQSSVRYRYLINNQSKIRYRLFYHCWAHLPKRWIYRFLIRERYDTEVAFYEGFPTEFIAHSTQRGSKKVAWLHFGNTDRFLASPDYWQSIYSQFDTMVTSSKDMRKEISGVIKNVPIEVCYNVLDYKRIIELGGEKPDLPMDQGMCFVSVGRLSAIKGYDRLLLSIAKLQAEGYKLYLTIVGGGEEEKNLRQLLVQYNLSNVVALVGNQYNPYPFITNAHWFVSVSCAEGFGLAILESMILGIPVLATATNGAKEIIGDDSKYGILMENSVDGIYKGIKHVLDNPNVYSHYRSLAIERSHYFSPDRILKQIESLL